MIEKNLAKINDTVSGDNQADKLAASELANAIKQQQLQIDNYKQNMGLRKEMYGRVWWLCVVACLFVASVTIAKFCVERSLSDQVLMALIAGVVTESLGILAIITHYLFPNR